jgi:replicative DNA helicase
LHPEEQIETDLPQSTEAEQAVLGAILLSESDAYDVVEGILRGEEFFGEAHSRIFRAMGVLRENEKPIDLITLTTQLQESGELLKIGGVSYLSGLAESVPTAANVAYYAEIVLDHYVKRLTITEAKGFFEKAKQSGDTADMIASLQDTQNKLSDRTLKGKDFHVIGDVCIQCFENTEKAFLGKSTTGVTGTPSGFLDLDKMTSGFQGGDLIILAARPSVGKTAFALNVAQNVGVREKKNVAVFSLEMGASQLVQRMICAEANVDANRLRTGFMEGDDWEKMTTAISALAEANIFIDDSPALNVNEIRAKCRRLKKEKGLDVILIDYLQLISGHGRRENRQQEVSHISRSLKQLARELGVPIIALSQLSRGVEQRQDKRPMMSDLRESGSIEQDADIVAFLYRDDYYDKESEKKNIIEIIIAKQRNGPVGTVELAFQKSFNKFVNLDRSLESQLEKPKRHPSQNSDKRRWA